MNLLRSILGRRFSRRDGSKDGDAVRQPEPPAKLTTVVSSSGGVLYAGASGRLVAVANSLAPAGAAVVAAVFPRRPDVAFLLPAAEPSMRIDMDRDALRATVLSYRIVPANRPDRFFLRHPNRTFFVCAAPGAPGQPVDISCNRDRPSGWEELSAGPDAAGTVSPQSSAWLAAIGRGLAGGETAAAFCDWLLRESDEVLAACGQAILRILDYGVLATVGYNASTDPRLGGRLRSILPNDPWTVTALPELGRWLADRKPASRLAIDPSLDFLGHDYVFWRGTWSITSLVTTLARTKVEPRRKLAVLATARNEGVYFLQWIAHYRALGVEHFFLYSNDNNDGSDALLSALAEAGEITWISNSFAPRVDGQLKAYSHCLSFAPHILDYRWTLIVDLDEFMVIDTEQYRSLPDLLDRRESGGATVVAFSWLMFTMGNNLAWSRRPLLERCTQRESADNTAIKSAFRTRSFITSYPHDPIPAPGVPAVYQNAAGEPHHWEGRDTPPSNGTPLYTHAWVNHYYFKSIDEFLWKSSRNRGGFEINQELQFKPDTLKVFARWNESISAAGETRALRHLPGLESEMRRLLALPGVSAAQDAVENKFTASVERLRDEALSSVAALPMDPELTSRLAALLSRTKEAARDEPARPLVATSKS